MARKQKSEQLKESSDNFLDAIVEKFGDNVLSNLRGDKVESMTTGSLSLDTCIGIGGFPRGRFTLIYGPEGSCKTTTALSTSLKEIENGGKVLYMDTENMLSFATIEQMLGKSVDRSKFILIQPETAEQAFMIIEKAITSKEFTLIVIDTIAALEPQEEKDKEFDENTMMATPRLMSKFFRRNAADVKNANVAVLLLNQIRDDTKSYMGGYKSTGGHALLHYSSVIIAFTKGVEIKQGEDKIGVNARFVVKKNKMGAPFRSFEIPIIFGRGIDYHIDAVSFCETLGVIQKSGSHYKFEGAVIGQGRNAAAEYLRNNPETLDKMTKLLYHTMNKQPQLIEEELELEGEMNE